MARRAADVLNRACRIELMRVQTQAGEHLGRVFDLRCSWRPGEPQPVIDEIVFGRIGLMERLGIPVRKPDSLPWSDVVEVRGHMIIVKRRP
jgi:hypothetical protein